LTPDIDLETHIRDVIGLLEYEDLERVVLVGHSYAGMVITGVAARVPERVAHLVYLDAFVPEEGDSLSRLLSPEREYFYRREAVIRGQGWRVPPPPTAALGLSDESDVAWVEARLTDQPLRTFDQPLAMRTPAEMPRTFIACTEGPIVASFSRFAEQAQSAPHWGYHELATGHDAMITMPEPLANLLLGLSPGSA
jgi:pimeloyl-ACP methyl ester carboxylesterase